MHDHGTNITSLAVIVLAALLCGMGMRSIKQPAVIGYILAGVILGPSALGLATDRAGIQLLAELGVLMLLFVIAMEISLQGIRAVWKIAASGKADFKFVVTGPEDIKEINGGFLNLIPREAVILMPEGDTAQKQLESMPWAMEECARHGFRFSPRLHVLAWNNERKR